MFYRERFYLLFFSLSFLFCSVVHASDPQKNPDTIIQESGGKWTGQLPNGSRTEIAPQMQMPKGPEITPDYGQNNPTSASSSNIGGSILNLIIDLGKPSQKEQANALAEKLSKQDAQFISDIETHGIEAMSHLNLTDRQQGILAKKAQQEMERQFKALTSGPIPPDPFANMPTPAPVTNTAAVATQVAHATTAVTQAVAQTPATQIPFQTTTIQSMLNQKSHPTPMIDMAKKIGVIGSPKPFVRAPGQPPMMGRLEDMPSTPPSSGPGFLQALGSGVAGAYGLAKGGAVAIIGGAKAATAATVAAAKGAGAYVVTVAAANPVGAAVVGGVVVAGGGYLLYKKFAGKVVMEAVAHREIHNAQNNPEPPHIEQPKIQLVENITPRPVHVDGPKTPRKNQPKSEMLHAQQTGNPREKGVKPFTIIKKGQGEKPHGYKDQWGHYADYNPKTEAKSFECFENGTYHGRNEDGIHVFTMTCPDTGGQLWVHALDNGGINNSGINMTHMPISDVHGLPFQPIEFVKPSGPGHGVKLSTATATGGLGAMMSSTSSTCDTGTLSFQPRYDKTLQLPDAPEIVTPEKAAKRVAKTRAHIESVLDRYEDEVIGGKPYSPEVRVEIRVQGREILAKHLSDEL